MKHRPEIDGLRAVAVVPVILFHAGFSGFSGGFAGVDVFFVISGFLITTIIAGALAEKKFSILNFYERRARRILPALFVVIAAAIPFAALWMLPSALKDFGESILSVLLFVSNLLFWRESGYFAPAVELKPLIHTWSLAIEEQFYIGFPILLWLLAFRGRRWMIIGLIVLCLLSLTLAAVLSELRPGASFYLLPTRAWELGVGAIVSVAGREAALRLDGRLRAALSGLGVAMIAFAIVAFNAATPHPSLPTVLPVLGAALILAFAGSDHAVGRGLATRPLVAIGQISYSAYLWHQPLFAFARIRSPAEPSHAVFALLILGTFILAGLTWWLIEMPFRNAAQVSVRTLAGILISSGLLLGASGTALALKPDAIVRFRLTDSDRAVLAMAERYKTDTPDAVTGRRVSRCFVGAREGGGLAVSFDDFAPECTDFGHPASIFLWGDSHAQRLSVMLPTLGVEADQLMAAGCPPNLGAGAKLKGCDAVGKSILAKIVQTKPEVLILAANWQSYDGYVDKVFPGLIRVLSDRLPDTTLIVVGQVPDWGANGLPDLIVSKGVSNDHDARLRPSNWSQTKTLNATLRREAAGHATFVDPTDVLCSDQGECRIFTAMNGQFEVSAWDRNHLTEASAAIVVRQIKAVLAVPKRHD